MIGAYALFEALLEEALPALRGIQVRMGDGVMRLVLEGAEVSLPRGAEAEVTLEDQTSYIKVPLLKAGEAE